MYARWARRRLEVPRPGQCARREGLLKTGHREDLRRQLSPRDARRRASGEVKRLPYSYMADDPLGAALADVRRATRDQVTAVWQSQMERIRDVLSRDWREQMSRII